MLGSAPKRDLKAALRLEGMPMGYESAPEGGFKAALRLQGMLKGCITPSRESYWTAKPVVA